MAKAKAVVAKKWYQSLTVWANLLVLIGVGLQTYTCADPIDPRLQAGIVVLVNLILRLKTGMPIELGKLTE